MYLIRTTGELDTIGYLYSCCTSLVAFNDDFAGKVNFRIVQYLTAGKTYYIRVRADKNQTGCYTLNVTDRIFASYVTINKKPITLEKGVLYELPITPNYTYKGYNGARRIPGLSVSIYPSNVDNNMVWWWEQYGSVLDCAYGWDDDGDRYIHLIASETGTAKLYAEDWAGNGSRDECTVTVTVEGIVNGYYNIINQQTNKALNIKGSYLMELVGREEVTIYDQTGSNEQIWNIDDVSSATTYIRSYIDEAYGLNAQVGSYPHKCDILKIVGNETDAAVRLISQSDGSYQIKLANYDRYLTATGTTNGSAVKWSSAQNNNSQRWKLIPVDFEQREAEKREYHLISQAGNGKALRVGEPNNNILSLNSNKIVIVETLSYWNRQKWTIKGTGTQKRLHTQLNDDYVLCNNGSNEAYVSSNTTEANSNLTITKYGSGADLYEIKLTSSNLPKIESAEMMFSASRSRRVSIVPIIQSLAQLEKNYGKEGAEIIVDNTQLTVFGGFAPNSETAQVLSKALGNRTVLSGSVSQSKNDPSRSLQMIERPLMTADELKALPKGTFIVTKTGFHPIKVRLKLFFEWGIRFEDKPFVVPLRDNTDIRYASKDALIKAVYEKYPVNEKKQDDEIPASSIAVDQVLGDKNDSPDSMNSRRSHAAKIHNSEQPM